MNQARQSSRISNTNPASVLQAIAALPGNIVEQRGRATEVFNPEGAEHQSIGFKDEPQPRAQNQSTAKIKLHVGSANTNSEVVEKVLESCVESAEQVQQLAMRLVQNEDSLRNREVDLDQRIADWDRHARKKESEINKKLSQLEQQESHVRCQQLHLMQLQTDIVKSHEATKQAIESIVVESGTDQKTISTLRALKYELSGRFDYIARRWEHLSRLMQNQRGHNPALGNEDSVCWEGEWA